MKKTINIRTDKVKGMGFYLGYQDNTIILLVPFRTIEIEFVSTKITA